MACACVSWRWRIKRCSVVSDRQTMIPFAAGKYSDLVLVVGQAGPNVHPYGYRLGGHYECSDR